MRRWDFTVYTILMILLVDNFIEKESAGYLILIIFMVFAFGKKQFDERGERVKLKQPRKAEKPKTYSEEGVDALLKKVEELGSELNAEKEGELNEREFV